jgi:type II secretion system protein J
MTTSARHRRRGFTLAELIVATVMISVLVGATYVAISQILRSRDKSQARSEAFARASAAADLIAADAASALRDANLADCRMLIIRDGKPGQGQDGLLLFSHLNRSVRPASNQAEGDEGEVQFRLQPGEHQGAMTLWRRTDPVIDEFPDAGGVASALVDGIKGVDIQANNGTDWVDDWDSDNDGIPYAVRVSVTGMDDKGAATLPARRVIAFDRVPLPSESEALADAAQAAADAAANATTSTGATSNTNTNTNTNGVLGGAVNRGTPGPNRGNGNGNGRGNGPGGNGNGGGGPGGNGGGGGGGGQGGPGGGGGGGGGRGGPGGGQGGGGQGGGGPGGGGSGGGGAGGGGGRGGGGGGGR